MPKYRKALSDFNPYMIEMMAILPTQSKITICNWTLDYAERVIEPLWITHHPDDGRPRAALLAARDWLSKKIKLPEAKTHILACHAAARENDQNPVAQTAARAIGQAASAIHSPRHAIGIAVYGALSVAYDALGADAPWAQLESSAGEECGRMLAALRAAAVENESNPSNITWPAGRHSE